MKEPGRRGGCYRRKLRKVKEHRFKDPRNGEELFDIKMRGRKVPLCFNHTEHVVSNGTITNRVPPTLPIFGSR